MINPVTGFTVIRGGCDITIGAIPTVHDENCRHRLARLYVLLQQAANGSLSPDELIEAEKLHRKISVHALSKENATILAYLDKGKLLLDAQKPNTAGEPVDLIMFDEGHEKQSHTENLTAPPSPRPSSIKSNISIPEEGRFISFTEQMLLFDTSISPDIQVGPAESTPPAYSSQLSTTASSSEVQDREDPIVEAIAKATKPKNHTSLKKAACWSFGFGVVSAAILVPQARRNLLSSKVKTQTIKNMYPEMDSVDSSSETSSTTKTFFSLGIVAALESKKQHQPTVVVSEC